MSVASRQRGVLPVSNLFRKKEEFQDVINVNTVLSAEKHRSDITSRLQNYSYSVNCLLATPSVADRQNFGISPKFRVFRIVLKKIAVENYNDTGTRDVLRANCGGRPKPLSLLLLYNMYNYIYITVIAVVVVLGRRVWRYRGHRKDVRVRTFCTLQETCQTDLTKTRHKLCKGAAMQNSLRIEISPDGNEAPRGGRVKAGPESRWEAFVGYQ